MIIQILLYEYTSYSFITGPLNKMAIIVSMTSATYNKIYFFRIPIDIFQEFNYNKTRKTSAARKFFNVLLRVIGMLHRNTPFEKKNHNKVLETD